MSGGFDFDIGIDARVAIRMGSEQARHYAAESHLDLKGAFRASGGKRSEAIKVIAQEHGSHWASITIAWNR